MFEEIVPIIIETLISNNRKLSFKELIEITDLDTPMVTRTLRNLRDLGILSYNNTEISLFKELKANQLAAAAQMGVDLSSFANYFKIDKKEKLLALDLATHTEKVKTLDINKRKPLIQSRSYYSFKKPDEITNILQNLLEASNSALHEHLSKVALKDKQLATLLELHSNAETSLLNYMRDKK